jgi:peptide/nickel transport system substrate-binding protein
MSRRGETGSTERGTERRTVLKACGTLAATAGVAGCLGGGDDDGGGNGGDNGGDNGTAPDEISRGGTLRVGADQDMSSLLPWSGFTGDYIVTEAMYDRLVTVDENFDPQPNLAQNWEQNDDSTVYTFTLADGATFANLDEEPVTADDVVATYEYLTSDDATLRSNNSISNIDEVTAVDDSTVEISLGSPDVSFLRRLCNPGAVFYILPQTVLEDDPSMIEDTDYGSGPFNLDEWQQQNFISFEAKPTYHRDGMDGEPLPYVDEYRWEIIPDGIARANALADGDLNALHRIPKRNASRLTDNDVLVERTMGDQLPIVLDTGVGPFDDVRVRQAAKHALDRTAIDTALALETSFGIHSGVTPIHENYNEEMSPGDTYGVTAQPEQAQELLSEAGYENGVEVQTFYYDDGFAQKETIAQLFQQQMSDVGIEFDIQRLTEEDWLSNYFNVSGEWYISNYSARSLGISVPSLVMHSDAIWNNEISWTDDEYDEAYNAATSATDPDTLAENLTQMQEINHERGAWLGTVYPNWPGAHKEFVQNYEMYPTPAIDFLSECAVNQ